MKKKQILKLFFLAVVFGLTAFFSSFCKVDLSEEEITEKRSVFFSYLEIKEYFLGVEEETTKTKIREIVSFLKEKKFNMILLQVRAFSDAIYTSEIFPFSKNLVENEGDSYPFDFLEYFISEAEKKNIEVHAWINPYRIRNDTNTSSINEKNPAYKWLNTNNVKVIEGKGIYYNPASLEVQDLIVKGIEELINNYDISGIHFDDYFYPDTTIDQEEYKEYQNIMSSDEFHLSQVNQLIRRVYQTVKQKDNLVFGISPEGNIENNYQVNYADVKTWLKEDGYIDYIMPQIYYGFENQIKPFKQTLQEWNDLIKNDVSLIPALALYKAGEIDKYAKSGEREWIESSDIIKREIEFSRTVSNYKGFSLFRFDYLYKNTDNTNLKNERELIFKLLSEI